MDIIPDVSNYQGAVDWSAVIRSGRVGGICKATEGLTYVDPTFVANWDRLGQLNAVRGAYHFARPDAAVPESQADKFLKVVSTTKPTDILVLDIEVGNGDLSNWALTFLNRVQAATGIKPWLYSYAPFIRAHLQKSDLAQFPLWLAAYQSTPPMTPQPWLSWQLWQHTDKASIPGIRGTCDESMGNIAPAIAPVGTKVKPMYDPPVGPFAAAWLDEQGRVISAITPKGEVYWGKWYGNVAGKPYWNNRTVALIGARPDAQSGYRITATDGAFYDLPDGLDKL